MKTFIFIFVLFVSLSINYSKYLDLVDEEIFEVEAKVVNIYNKKDYKIAKLHTRNFDFFTSFEQDEDIKKLDDIKIALITTKVTFVDFLKGFFAKKIYFDKLNLEKSIKDKLANKIEIEHKNEKLKELFQALFLAIPISKELREVCTAYGISHLIALSGFHLAVLSFLIYAILYFPYKIFQTKYFPYRNRKYDLFIISVIVLFFYLLLTNIVPSLLRAFVMLVLAMFLLRSDIKILSFKMLFFTVLIILSIFPKYFFSLGFWFSVSAVFYIFLYLKYFININKYLSLLFFNFWIFFAMNPIVHYFFATTSVYQLLSPFLTLAFVLFYPFELLIHLLGFGSILDSYLQDFINFEFTTYEVYTPFIFLLSYLIFSFISIFYKWSFYILNILLILFSLYLYF